MEIWRKYLAAFLTAIFCWYLIDVVEASKLGNVELFILIKILILPLIYLLLYTGTVCAIYASYEPIVEITSMIKEIKMKRNEWCPILKQRTYKVKYWLLRYKYTIREPGNVYSIFIASHDI